MKIQIPSILLALCLAIGNSNFCAAQQGAATSRSPLQTTLERSQQEGKYTLIVFYSENTAETQQMFQTAVAESKSGTMTVTTAQVNDPAEETLVQKFGVGRAPMPMTVVIAPNGALTGMFPRQLAADRLANAIVPPVMMECMKALQEQKLVFVCLTKSEKADVPIGVQGLQLDPMFKDRIALVALNVEDAREVRLIAQLKVNASQVNGPFAALIAPPGVLVGHFGASSSSAQIAAAIHKSGKCCEDPNCKHNVSAQSSSPARR